MNRHQLDRGHTQLGQVGDDLVRGQPQEPARMGDLGSQGGQPLHMGLIQDRVGPGRIEPQAFAPSPCKGRVHNDRARHVGGAVAAVEAQILVGVSDLVAVERIIPLQVPGQGLGIGVHQQLERVEAVPLLGRVGAVDAVAVLLPWAQTRQVSVPDMPLAFGQVDQVDFPPVVIAQAQHDPRGMAREDGEIDALAVESGAKRVRAPRAEVEWDHLAAATRVS